MAKVVQEKWMDVSLDLMREVILDIESYPEFLSEVCSAEKTKETPKGFEGTFEIEVMKRFKYKLSFQSHSPGEINWSLSSSDFFKKNEGYWKLIPEKGGVKAIYAVDVDFGFLVPSWVTKKLTATQLPKMLENFEKRCQNLQKQRNGDR